MNIIFLAAPGAGKGTLSDMLKAKYGYNHISAGEVLREEVSSGSELGNEIKAIIDKGMLIDDELMKKLMLKKLSSLDKSKNFIFDGYPRTVVQVNHYKEICKELEIEEAYGIYLYIDKDVAMKRALGRRNCPNCKRGYNIYSDDFKPMVEGICDDCNVELISRNDDNEESFNKRFDTYLKETEPLIKIFDVEGKLVEFDALKNSSKLFSEIEEFLEKNK
ncbi:MAG: nucleoside monophosphate kinase [Bacilli bacterium]|nr:nucleoside monophosphate kinase [Bacilli bacterium]